MNFEKLIEEFGGAIGTPLGVDDNNACLLILEDNLQVQLEPHNHHLLIGSSLGRAPLGKGQENLFRVALIENGLPPPRYGILGFSRKTGELVLHSFLDLRMLNGEKVAEHFHPFAKKARIWRNAMQEGRIPAVKRVVEE